MRGQDFSADDPLQITFIPGVNESCAMVSIIDDNALEGDHAWQNYDSMVHIIQSFSTKFVLGDGI